MLKSVETIGAKDHAEAIAIFRAQVIAPLCVGRLGRGERAELLSALSEQTFTPPGADTSRCYAAATIERWLYRYRRGGITALRPVSRERGAALVLTGAQRELLVQIREQHPSASAELIVSTLEHDGRLLAGAVSPNTVRRLFRLNGLDKKSARAAERGSIRRRWQAATVNELWHADVCHGPALSVDGRNVPLRIHALLDDHSRRIIAIQACVTERESEMLMLLVKALRLHDAPRTLYLDNGATYSGDALKTVCARLGIALVHAKPYDPEARGKMERFYAQPVTMRSSGVVNPRVRRKCDWELRIIRESQGRRAIGPLEGTCVIARVLPATSRVRAPSLRGRLRRRDGSSQGSRGQARVR